MTDYIGNYKNRPRRVVFYGRVSTEHEEQTVMATIREFRMVQTDDI